MGRNKFKSITAGLLGSFLSRNNDVNGYWGIGKLYAFMKYSNTYKIEIDLVHQSMTPPSETFKSLIVNYSSQLYANMKSDKLPIEYLSEAKMFLTGIPLGTNNGMNRMRCTVIIQSDLGKQFIAKSCVYCRAHNPSLEQRSTRWKG